MRERRHRHAPPGQHAQVLLVFSRIESQRRQETDERVRACVVVQVLHRIADHAGIEHLAVEPPRKPFRDPELRWRDGMFLRRADHLAEGASQ